MPKNDYVICEWHLILREFLGRLMYYHVNNYIILCEF